MSSDSSVSNTYLSKSLYIRGLQCLKSLYLHKNHPELRNEISDEQEAQFQTGYEVGDYAKQLFPGGVEIPYEGLTHSEQIEKTRAEIEKGMTTIYEAAFSHNSVFVKVDILHKGPEGWDIYEVKSAAELKEIYLDDISVQYYVVTGSGLPVARAQLVYINSQYVRSGSIEPAKLFNISDVTSAAVEKQVFVQQTIVELQTMLSGSMPDIDIGEYCDIPYRCDFRGHCRQHIPKDSVFDLGRKGVNKYKLYRQGIIEMKDIPLDMLNRAQKMQVEALVNKGEVIDKDAIKAFLDALFYPLCFLDFETVYPPIPLFDGTRPYQQVPFQFSLHLQENKQFELKHYEFLAAPGVDPRREIAERLLNMIPSNACIVTYTDFEAKRLRDLADWLPEYKQGIESRIENIRDLAVPFKQMDYYHWQMNGSYSLKTVLPRLISDMDYEGLEIRNGGMAVDAFSKMSKSNNPAEIAGIRRALLDYCKLDTLAMSKIVERLRELSQ